MLLQEFVDCIPPDSNIELYVGSNCIANCPALDFYDHVCRKGLCSLDIAFIRAYPELHGGYQSFFVYCYETIENMEVIDNE